MKPFQHVIWAAALLSACGGNPFTDGDTTGAPAGTTGTGNSAKSTITRTEAKGTGAEAGNGYATGISIIDPDAEVEGDETFTVDGLAFDGDNVYQRGSSISELGPFQVYEGDPTTVDPTTGVDIPQFVYRAVYGASTTGKTNFAIVRTGSYVDYGFGGFVFNRKDGITLPTTGEATYSGQYAGLRDFNNAAGLEYVSGTVNMAIDFSDFNDGNGIQGSVTDRAIFDINGADITGDVIFALNEKLDLEPDPVTGLTKDVALEALPVLNFAVGPGVLKASGEVDGSIYSFYTQYGKSTQFESGKFYALISDTNTQNAQEVVGIIRVTAEDPRFSGVTVRETGGFILYHQ